MGPKVWRWSGTARLTLLALLVAAGPVTLSPREASAQALPTHVWASEYFDVPVAGGAGARSVELRFEGAIDGHRGQHRRHLLPFDFRFPNGAVSREINIGAKGYITAGADETMFAANTISPQNLLLDTNPRNLIAAWWGDHFCDPDAGEVKTQLAGVAPERVYIIQWHCSLRLVGEEANTRFKTQIWLHEGSNLIQVKYGDVSIDAGRDWPIVSWGLKGPSGAGTMGPDLAGALGSCHPSPTVGGGPRCSGLASFPRFTTIQYGHSPGADLTASIEPESSLVSETSLAVEVETALRNIGSEQAAGLTYDLYLSPGPGLLLDAVGTQLLVAGQEGGTVTAGATKVVYDSPTISRPANGRYWICVALDPNGAIDDSNRDNDSVCSRRNFVVGPDLVGTIEAPASGAAGGEVRFPITIKNVGTDPSGHFNFRVKMVPELMNTAGQAVEEEIYLGSVPLGLAPGRELEEEITARLPPIIRGDRYAFVLVIDPEQGVDEADRSNNSPSSINRMENLRPALRIERQNFSLHLPDGCYYGEEVEAEFTICNLGRADAWNFHPGVAFGNTPSLSFLTDVPAASFPQVCHLEGQANYHACEPIGGKLPVCAFWTCRLPCVIDDDCEFPLVCGDDPDLADVQGEPGAKSCMNYLSYPVVVGATKKCRTFVAKGRIPMVDEEGEPYQPGNRYFHFIDDMLFSLSEAEPDVVSSGNLFCDEALPDLSVESLSVPTRLEAGKLASIGRRIDNLGFIPRPLNGQPPPPSIAFGYQYFLSKVPDVSAQQIPLGSSPSGGGVEMSIGRKAMDLGMDAVWIPEHVEPGEYYLGLVLDPANEHRELSKTNNVRVWPNRVRIDPAPLAVDSLLLPVAIVGGRYRYQFAAIGAVGPLQWSAEGLPAGLSLTEGGTLEGIVSEEGTFPFYVEVRSGRYVARELVALRAVEPLGSLEVSTERLPPAVRNLEYGGWIDGAGTPQRGVPLAANGGLPPYRWEIDRSIEGNELPQGLIGPTADGVIGGQATTQSRSSSFVVKVSDELGNVATKELSIQVVGAADLVITSRLFSAGRTARPYDSCIDAAGGAGELRWEVEEQTLPPGLRLVQREAQGCLVGTPTTCGNYVVKASVQSGDLRYAASLPLSVECEALRLGEPKAFVVQRGEEVELELDSSAGVEFSVVQGRLPQGLSLETAGVIRGQVSAEADFGSHNLVVELQDEGGRRGYGAVTIEVAVGEPAPSPPPAPTGCSSGAAGGASGGFAWAACLLGLFALRSSGRSLGRGPGRVSQAGLLPEKVARPSASSGRVSHAALLIFTLALASCGGGDETKERSRCDGVSCAEGFECDPGDGSCKCGGPGGLSCAAGESCLLEPSPSCWSAACEFVSCEGGERCDPFSGECICGSAPCDEGLSCVDSRCVGEDRCEGVECPAGSICDPASGGCSCGGTSCEAGSVCIEGACRADLCLGVHCGANGTCDPEDGICRCGSIEGEICASGEVCEAIGGGFRCERSERCEEVRCIGGTSCDPSDGLCRCGGVGPQAPVCGADEFCFEGACLGGSLCAPAGEDSGCAEGLSCDPADGICKCGGAGGVICAAEELCVGGGAVAPSCAKPCQLMGAPTGCGEGEGCYFDPALPHGRAFCAKAGPRTRDDNCDHAAHCRPGFFCSVAQRCRDLCLRGPGILDCSVVSPTAYCTEIPSGPADVGFCAEG